jgi:hypothetical protein
MKNMAVHSIYGKLNTKFESTKLFVNALFIMWKYKKFDISSTCNPFCETKHFLQIHAIL